MHHASCVMSGITTSCIMRHGPFILLSVRINVDCDHINILKLHSAVSAAPSSSSSSLPTSAFEPSHRLSTHDFSNTNSGDNSDEPTISDRYSNQTVKSI